jgi:hypothetical protein
MKLKDMGLSTLGKKNELITRLLSGGSNESPVQNSLKRTKKSTVSKKVISKRIDLFTNSNFAYHRRQNQSVQASAANVLSKGILQRIYIPRQL